MTETTVNIFEQASRQQLRFDVAVGKISVEDLWKLPLTSDSGKVNLDAIAVELNTALESSQPKSFVNNEKKNTVLQLKFDIVKHIIDTRQAETAAKVEGQQKQAQRNKLDELIASKQDQALSNMSLEDLQKMRDAL